MMGNMKVPTEVKKTIDTIVTLETLQQRIFDCLIWKHFYILAKIDWPFVQTITSKVISLQNRVNFACCTDLIILSQYYQKRLKKWWENYATLSWMGTLRYPWEHWKYFSYTNFSSSLLSPLWSSSFFARFQYECIWLNGVPVASSSHPHRLQMLHKHKFI